MTLQTETLVQSKWVVYKKNNCIVTLDFNYLQANQPAVQNNTCEHGEKEKNNLWSQTEMSHVSVMCLTWVEWWESWVELASRSHTALWPEGNTPLLLPAGTREDPHPRVYPWCHTNILKSATCQEPVATHLYWEHDTSDANSLPSSLTGHILRHYQTTLSNYYIEASTGCRDHLELLAGALQHLKKT